MTARAPWRFAALALAAALALGAAPAGADASPGQAPAGAAEPAPRVVAIGDVHGALDPFRELLRRLDLIDAQDRWIGGDAVLVQTGDVTDRGADVRGVIALLSRLQSEAAAAGGGVIALLGNHEGMNLVHEYRDVGSEAYARFVDAGSEKRRKDAYEDWRTLIRGHAERRGLQTRFSAESRREWLEAHPPGALEYRAAMEPGGEMGAWLRERETVVRVADTIFVHGGIGPELETRSLEEINHLIAGEIAAYDAMRESLIASHDILRFFDRGETAALLREVTGHGETSSEVQAAALAHLESLPESWMFSAGGPLWFRGYARWSDEELAPFVERLLDRYGAQRIVVGHTPSESSRIVRRLDDRLILIDTGMYWSSDGPGRASAVEILGGRVREIYLGEEEPLEPAGALMPRAELLAAAVSTPAAPDALAVPPRRLLGPDGEPLLFRSDEEILAFLESAEIVEWSDVGAGVTRPRRIVLEKSGYRLRAIFHDVDEVRDRVRLPERGLVLNYKDSYRSQVAAYHVARLLGFDNVPPAVLKEWGRERGSAALWIEGAKTEGARRAAGEEALFPADYHRRFYDLRVFDNLINNTDRNQGNLLFDSVGKFWFVDHTRSFGVSKTLPDPDQVTRCSHSLWNALRALGPQAVEARLSDLLSKGERHALLKRRDLLVRLLEERIEQLGEYQVLFTHGEPSPDVQVTTQP